MNGTNVMILGRVGGSFREGIKRKSATQVAMEFNDFSFVIFGPDDQACLCTARGRP
ncbi:hypothetical protein D1872_302580 [compost metagenome]